MKKVIEELGYAIINDEPLKNNQSAVWEVKNYEGEYILKVFKIMERGYAEEEYDFYNERYKSYVKVMNTCSRSYPRLIESKIIKTEFLTLGIVVEEKLSKTLENHISEHKSFSVSDVVAFMIEIVKVLKYAVEDGSPVHRDISPDNIMLRKNGEYVLIDPGCAKHISESTTFLIGKPLGKFHWRSPEFIKLHNAVSQAEADKIYSQIDYRSDMYSVGLIAYRMLYKESINQKDVEKKLKLLISNSEDEIKQKLLRVIFKMMRFEINRRFKSYDELLNFLKKVGV